jgi:hypothetical protein
MNVDVIRKTSMVVSHEREKEGTLLCSKEKMKRKRERLCSGSSAGRRLTQSHGWSCTPRYDNLVALVAETKEWSGGVVPRA